MYFLCVISRFINSGIWSDKIWNRVMQNMLKLWCSVAICPRDFIMVRVIYYQAITWISYDLVSI